MGNRIAKQESISFMPIHSNIVERVMERYGFSGKSAAVQFIISDWAVEKQFIEQAIAPSKKTSHRPRRIVKKSGKPIDAIHGVQKGIAE